MRFFTLTVWRLMWMLLFLATAVVVSVAVTITPNDSGDNVLFLYPR